jgi:hypothetical protein
MATAEWMGILSLLGVLPADQSSSQKAILKSVKRAVAKCKLSTLAARKWFQKHHILNRLNDGIKAEKRQQPTQQIAA